MFLSQLELQLKTKNIGFGFEKNVFPLTVGRMTLLTLLLSLVVVQGQELIAVAE